MGAYPTINLNDSVPAATSGFSNVTWQSATSVHSSLITNVSAQVPNLKASGTGHQGGLVPDPGAVAGTSKFLREDATWALPGGGGGISYAADSGSVNALVVAPALSSLSTGTPLLVKVANTNTSAATIAVDGGGATPIKKDGATALQAGDMSAGAIYLLVYDGTNWQLTACLDAKFLGGTKVSQSMTPSDGDLLTYVSANSDWENKAPGTLSGFNASKFQGVSVSSATPQTGDTFRYNMYGDNKWDIGTFFWPTIFGRCDGRNVASMASFGTVFTTYTFSTSTNTVTNAGATEPAHHTLNTGVTAALTTRGLVEGNTSWTLGTFWRAIFRCKMNQTANVRYWIGIGSGNIVGATAYGTDTPNTSYAMFRFSATTDATIKAVCGTATASQTVANTGVSVDTTASHIFEIAYDGTHVNFYIDGALVAQITTNLPATSTLISGGVACDNKNTSNDVSIDVAWLGVMLK
jgi:hypothetical protein